LPTQTAEKATATEQRTNTDVRIDPRKIFN
jgi:hypothetical protein